MRKPADFATDIATAVRRLALAGSTLGLLAAQGPAPGSPDARDPATYLPLLPGTQWTWRATWTGDDGKPYELVERARAFGLVPAGPLRTCTQLVFDRRGECEYYAAGPDGLVCFAGATIGSRGARGEGGPLLPGPVGAETRWQWQTEICYQSTVTQSGVWRPQTPEYDHHLGELLDFDVAVTVPAGTFRCVHVRYSRQVDGEFVPECERWYGRGVGLVREVLPDRHRDRVLVAFAAPEPARADRDAVLHAWLQAQPDAADAAQGAAATTAWVPPDEWSHFVHGDFAVVRRDGRRSELVFVEAGVVVPFALADVAFWQARLDHVETFAAPGSAHREVAADGEPVASPRSQQPLEHVAGAIASLRVAQLGPGVREREPRAVQQKCAAALTTCTVRVALATAAGGQRILTVLVEHRNGALSIAISDGE